jgi:hypothetical protein
MQVSIAADNDHATEAQVLELIRELRQVPGVVISRPKTEAPEGSKSGVVDIVGSVSIAISTGAVAPMTTILYDWVKRRRQHISMQIKVAGATLTFPEVEFAEAMEMLKRNGLQPDTGMTGPGAGEPGGP